MALQNLNVSSEANSGQGDRLRDAFILLRKMFAEVYGVTYTSDTQDLSTGSIDFKVDANRVELTNTANSGTDGYVLTYDDATGGFTLEQKFDGDITGIVAGSGLSGDAASGEATLNIDLNDLTEEVIDTANDLFAFVDSSDSNNTKKESIAHLVAGIAGAGLTSTSGSLDVIGGDGITANANEIEVTVDDSTVELSATDGSGAIRVKDDGITHAKLEPRYTDSKTDYGSISTDTTIDWSAAAVHEITMTGAATLNFNNYKKGQVIDLLITGNVTITFGTVSGTPSINQVGSSTYDGTKTNIIQVLCTDDDATPTFLFAVGDYTSDTNPS